MASALGTNDDFRAYCRARREADGYKPPTPDWISALGDDVPLLTLGFAQQVVANWDRDENPKDPCARAMDALLEYHEHSPYINVLVNFELEGNGVRTVGVITRRSAFLYALWMGYDMRVGESFFGSVRLSLDDEDIQFLELVYPANDNDFFAMCDGGYKKTTPLDDFTAWADAKPGYREFCDSPKSRLTVDETLVQMHLAKATCEKEEDDSMIEDAH
jgi:hypothetical protein